MLKVMLGSAMAALLAVGSASAAYAGWRLTPQNATFISCQLSCVKALDGTAANYKICTNNVTGQTVSIARSPSQRGCHTFP